MKRTVLASWALCACLLASTALGAVPERLHYSGKLDTAGGAFTGTIDVTFVLYDSADGTTGIWSDSQAVSVTEGRFHVQLGPLSAADVDVAALHLGVTVGTDDELALVAISSVPYALRAGEAGNAATVGGKAAAAFADATHSHALADLILTDALDFTEFKDILTLDATTTFKLGSASIFQIQSGSGVSGKFGSGGDVQLGLAGTTGNVGIGVTPVNGIKLRVSGDSTLDGNVGIGTNPTPGYKLAVYNGGDFVGVGGASYGMYVSSPSTDYGLRVHGSQNNVAMYVSGKSQFIADGTNPTALQVSGDSRLDDLDVSGTSTFSGTSIFNGSSYLNGNVSVGGANSVDYKLAVKSEAAFIGIGSSAYGMYVSSPSTAYGLYLNGSFNTYAMFVNGTSYLSGEITVANGKLKATGGLSVTGTATATAFEGDGSGLTNVAIAANTIGNSQMADNSVGSAEVIADSLTAADLAAGSVGASEIAAGAVGTSELTDGVVTTTKISGTTLITSGETFSDSDTQIPTAASVINYVAANAGSDIAADSITFSDLADNATLDANYAVNLSSRTYTFNMNSSGDVYFNDGSTTHARFNDAGDIQLGNSSEIYVDTSENRVGVLDTTPSFTLDVNGVMRATGGVKVGDNSTTCNATNAGLLRYRVYCTSPGLLTTRISRTEMCMQTGANTYLWQTIKSYTFSDSTACPGTSCGSEGDPCIKDADCCAGFECSLFFGTCGFDGFKP